MSKILILFNKKSFNKTLFCDHLKKNLPPNVNVDARDLEDVSVDINFRNIEICVGGTNFEDYDLVYFRRAGGQFMWLAGTIALYLNFRGIKYFDTTYREVGPMGSKLASFLKMAYAGLPVIPSYYCHRSLVNLKEMEIVDKFNLPLVAKEISSQRGEGVCLITKREDFQELIFKNPEKNYIFQKYIPASEEYRVLVLGQEIGAYERKTPTDVGEFRSNVALGAKEEFMDVRDIPENFKVISLKAAKTLGVEIAGVDILVDKVGQPWILEVNRGPGITYEDPKSDEMKNLAKFFVQERGNSRK
jgi:glutathione synthase/RimK-type ligase-like ATP-grasp enzyme